MVQSSRGLPKTCKSAGIGLVLRRGELEVELRVLSRQLGVVMALKASNLLVLPHRLHRVAWSKMASRQLRNLENVAFRNGNIRPNRDEVVLVDGLMSSGPILGYFVALWVSKKLGYGSTLRCFKHGAIVAWPSEETKIGQNLAHRGHGVRVGGLGVVLDVGVSKKLARNGPNL